MLPFNILHLLGLSSSLKSNSWLRELAFSVSGKSTQKAIWISKHKSMCNWMQLKFTLYSSKTFLRSLEVHPSSTSESLQSGKFSLLLLFFSLCNSEVIAVRNAARMFNSPDLPGSTKFIPLYSLNTPLIREWQLQWKRKAQCKEEDISIWWPDWMVGQGRKNQQFRNTEPGYVYPSSLQVAYQKPNV